MTMLHSDGLQHMTLPEQFFEFSLSYLRASTQLCISLAHATEGGSYTDGCVILALTRHAIELYLKGAILAKSEMDEADRSISGHDLDTLYDQYRRAYPNDVYALTLPFQIGDEKSVDIDLDNEEVDRSRVNAWPRPDQLYRYPANRDFRPWDGAFAFIPGMFLVELEELTREFVRARDLY